MNYQQIEAGRVIRLWITGIIGPKAKEGMKRKIHNLKLVKKGEA